ncbi:MAG: hypothetical protein AAGA66_14235 [Bacteroidota bacterium]
MIFDTTYTDKEVTKSINDLVGKSFGFWDRIKLNGIGSPRMIVLKVTPKLSEYINPGESTNYTNIELRPEGIIVHLKKRTQTYGWVIPFQYLSFNDTLSEISDEAHTIQLNNPSHDSLSFLNKIIKQKQLLSK